MLQMQHSLKFVVSPAYQAYCLICVYQRCRLLHMQVQDLALDSSGCKSGNEATLDTLIKDLWRRLQRMSDEMEQLDVPNMPAAQQVNGTDSNTSD